MLPMSTGTTDAAAGGTIIMISLLHSLGDDKSLCKRVLMLVCDHVLYQTSSVITNFPSTIPSRSVVSTRLHDGLQP